MIDRQKLAKLLGMFSSSHDGEVVNAARLVEKMRRDTGLSWPQILAEGDDGFDAAIAPLLDHLNLLSAWEREFVISIAGRSERELSPKQRAVLQRLRLKAKARRRAA
jgi:hypothetical protein